MNAVFYASASLAVFIEWFRNPPEFIISPPWLIAVFSLFFVASAGYFSLRIWTYLVDNGKFWSGIVKSKILVAILVGAQFILATIVKMVAIS